MMSNIITVFFVLSSITTISSSLHENDDVHVEILRATRQNLALRNIIGGESHSKIHKCTMITIVLDTPIYVRNEWGENRLIPYGPPSHSKRSRDVFFNVSTSSKHFKRENLITALNAYDPEQISWKRKAFNMFSRGYESSHHVIEILVSSRISSSERVTFDIPSSVTLFDRSGHRLRIPNLPIQIVLPKHDTRVHFATVFDVVTPMLNDMKPCGKIDLDDEVAPLSQVELADRIRIPGLDIILKGVIGVVVQPAVQQISAVDAPEQQDTLGTKITEETGANAPIKITEYVTSAVTYNLNALLTDSITKRVSASMSKLIIDRLSPVISSASKDRILDSVRHKVGESISNTLVRDLNENLVRDISRSLLMSLTNTLTRSVTHSVVPTIAMATSYDVKTDLSCRKCFETSQSVFCEACPYSSEASYYHGYYSTYYSDWYANYYADYYAQAVRNVDKMKYGENMNQLKSEENKPPKQVVGGVLGSLKGALGAIIP